MSRGTGDNPGKSPGLNRYYALQLTQLKMKNMCTELRRLQYRQRWGGHGHLFANPRMAGGAAVAATAESP